MAKWASQRLWTVIAMGEPLVWVTAEDVDPDTMEDIADDLDAMLPDHEVIVTADDLELIDAEEMHDALEKLIG